MKLDSVIIGELMIDFRDIKSESSPFITTFSKISLSVTIPTYSPFNDYDDDVTRIISTFLGCNILIASATEEFSSAVTN
jgi:hypothetical protein